MPASAAVARQAAESPDAQHLGSYRWAHDHPDFGGLSGLELAADGSSLITISDRGMIFTADIARDGAGVITAITLTGMRRQRDVDGQPLGPGLRDSEGLAQLEDGTLCISYEGPARILCHPPGADRPHQIPDHPAFATLPVNGALEALAVDRHGRLYTLPERSGRHDAPFPVWRRDGQGWQTVAKIRRDAGFLAVGADFGPDGRFYLLERGFNGIGFRSRVRSFLPDDAGWHDERLHLQTRILQHDNLEGISVWRDRAGRIRLSLVSDDNFRRLQRTEIVEYVID